MRRIIALCIVWFCVTALVAQDMKSLFVSMPDSLAPLLTKVNREDCIDFLDSDMKAVVRNRFDKESELKTLTGDYLLMQMTASSTLEMKMLPLDDSLKVVCMVRTVDTGVADSDIQFYDTFWRKLPVTDFVSLPQEDVFYLPVDSLSEAYESVRKMADMYLLKLSLSPEQAILKAEYTTPLYLNDEAREKALKCVRKEPLLLEWRNGRFE